VHSASRHDVWEIHRGWFVARDIPVIRVEITGAITLKRACEWIFAWIRAGWISSSARLRKAPTDVSVGSANFHADTVHVSSTRKSTWAETIGDYVGVSEDRVQILFLLLWGMRIYNKHVKMKKGSVVFGWPAIRFACDENINLSFC
jgi:hypothetical protein